MGNFDGLFKAKIEFASANLHHQDKNNLGSILLVQKCLLKNALNTSNLASKY